MSDRRAIRLSRLVTLADGGQFKMRPLDRGDAHYFVEHWPELSERSRYLRFCAPKEQLAASEIAFLVAADQIRHVAVGALDLADPVPRPAAVGRYFRTRPDGADADLAITVLDAWQGRGLGRAVFELLKADARRQGIDRFRATLMWDNGAVQHLVNAWGGQLVDRHRGMAEALIPLSRSAQAGLS
ncbi:MAG: GNAT family N-acetyltransferase [Rhodothalassiaceae bacterium]